MHRYSYNGGCFFATSSFETARKAVVLWDPSVSMAVIPAVSVSLRGTAGSAAFRIRDVDGRVSIVKDPAGTEHVLIAGSQCCAQLTVRGCSVLRPCRLLTALQLPSGHAGTRLAAISD